MRPTSFVLGEERSMMQNVLAGRDADLSNGMGIILNPFAKNVGVSQRRFDGLLYYCDNYYI